MSKDSISTKQDLDDFNEVTAQFVNYFLYNRSFKMGCDILKTLTYLHHMIT